MIINQIAHGFTKTFVRHNGTIWVAAQANNVNNVATFFAYKIDNDRFYLDSNLLLKDFSDITDDASTPLSGNTKYYLSATVAGSITSVAPAIKQDVLTTFVTDAIVNIEPYTNATFEASGSINIPSGQQYKINGVALSKSDVGLSSVTNDAQLKISSNLSDLNNRQTALDNLTGVSSATNEWVLTKDTSTGNAVFKALPVSTGEANTASNVGSVGTGIFKQKSGVDLQLYKLAPLSTKLSIVLQGTDYIGLDVTEANINHNALSNYVANQHIDWTNTSSNLVTTGTLQSSGLTLNFANNDYVMSQVSGNNLQIQSQTAGTASAIDFFTKDGDGTDNAAINLYAIGNPSDYTNTELCRYQYYAAGQYYRLASSSTGTGVARPIKIDVGDTQVASFTESGMGINGVDSPTARLHLPAGTATAGTAPLKFTTGTALTTPSDGAVEYHNSHLYFTIGSTRYQLDQQVAADTNIAKLNVAQSWSAKQTFTTNMSINTNVGFTLTVPTISAGAVTINWGASNKQKVNLTSNITNMTFTAPTNGACNLVLMLTQDATGGRTVAFPAGIKWMGGTAPTVTATASKTDIINIFYDGTSYFAAAVQNF